MQRAGFVLIGILVLALVASGLAEATMVLGTRNRTSDEQHARPSFSPTPTPPPSPSATATPPPTPTPTPAAPTATTISFVHMRSGASTATPIVVDLNGGTVVTLGSYVDSQWQQVSYNGYNGYIFRSYLQY